MITSAGAGTVVISGVGAVAIGTGVISGVGAVVVIRF
jgi:hypothetical protein